MACQPTTVRTCSLHIDMDSILNTFKLGVTSGDTSNRDTQSDRTHNDANELAELIQNAPPEDIFSLLVAGDLIDWTVLQHTCIIARSLPAAMLGEKLCPIGCACAQQGNEEEVRTIIGKRQRKRKRKKALKQKRSFETSWIEVSLNLSRGMIASDKWHSDIIQRLSARQAGFARRMKSMKEEGTSSADCDIDWTEHQAYLDDARELAICADLKPSTGFMSRDCGGLKSKKENRNNLQEEKSCEKNLKGSSVDQENSSATQFARDEGSLISKKQKVELSRAKQKTSMTKNTKRPRSKQKNTSNLRAHVADHTAHKHAATANKPDQSAEEVFRMDSMDTNCSATLATAGSTSVRKSPRKTGANHMSTAVDGKASRNKNLAISTRKVMDEISVNPNISLLESGHAEPKLKNKSRLLGVNHQNRSPSVSTLQPENVGNAESDTSDISSLTSCPSSSISPISPPTPDKILPFYEATKATHRSNSEFFTTDPRNDSKDPQRSSFSLQYMKPHVAEAAYGLIQEALVNDPFALLVAVTLLNRTKGTAAVPIFFTLMSDYSTPERLAAAPNSAIVPIIGRLGLQNNRAKSLIGMARRWWYNDAAPRKGLRYRTLHYPFAGAGSSIRPGETVADEADDPREGAFEIGHLPGIGPYALDSWRIFCRDMLRGLAKGYNGEGAEAGSVFEPEWKRVLPKDKELRGFLKWMWAKEGVEWDPVTGDKRRT